MLATCTRQHLLMLAFAVILWHCCWCADSNRPSHTHDRVQLSPRHRQQPAVAPFSKPFCLRNNNWTFWTLRLLYFLFNCKILFSSYLLTDDGWCQCVVEQAVKQFRATAGKSGFIRLDKLESIPAVYLFTVNRNFSFSWFANFFRSHFQTSISVNRADLSIAL